MFGKKVFGDSYKSESGISPFRYISGTVKKIMVYETVKKEETNTKEKNDEILTKEERINLIRYGPNADKKEEKKIAINLLRKYKPIINLNRYRRVAEELEDEEKEHAEAMKIERANFFTNELDRKLAI